MDRGLKKCLNLAVVTDKAMKNLPISKVSNYKWMMLLRYFQTVPGAFQMKTFNDLETSFAFYNLFQLVYTINVGFKVSKLTSIFYTSPEQ